MVDKAPAEQMLALALSPKNLSSVMGIMHNPIRNVMDIHMKGLESLTWGLFATEGNPANAPAALGMVAIERMEDPIAILKIFIESGLNTKGKIY